MSIYPVVRYTDAKAAIAFLTNTFGLIEEQVNNADDGSVGHAELSWDGGIVMLGTRTGDADPVDTGRAVLYLTVDDVDHLQTHRPALRIARIRGARPRGQRMVLRHLPASRRAQGLSYCAVGPGQRRSAGAIALGCLPPP